jgi:hypothetical protein
MVTRISRTWRCILAPLLAACSFGSLVVAPLLDSLDRGHRAVIESAHDPDHCVREHDHSICTQVVASRALPPDHGRQHQGALVERASTIVDAREWVLLHHAETLPLGSRAPPTV